MDGACSTHWLDKLCGENFCWRSWREEISRKTQAYKNNTCIYLQEIWCDDEKWIDLAQDRKP
jgi:hypothetical protein